VHDHFPEVLPFQQPDEGLGRIDTVIFGHGVYLVCKRKMCSRKVYLQKSMLQLGHGAGSAKQRCTHQLHHLFYGMLIAFIILTKHRYCSCFLLVFLRLGLKEEPQES
jgi:hypothetical protein